jgi:hypothetical protein
MGAKARARDQYVSYWDCPGEMLAVKTEMDTEEG